MLQGLDGFVAVLQKLLPECPIIAAVCSWTTESLTEVWVEVIRLKLARPEWERLPQHKAESFGLFPLLDVFRATSFCSPRPSGRSLLSQTSSPFAPTLMTSMTMPKTCLEVRWVTVAVVNTKQSRHTFPSKTCFHFSLCYLHPRWQTTFLSWPDSAQICGASPCAP